MFSHKKTDSFSYKEEAPAIWRHLLNKAAAYFRMEEGINKDYASTLACYVIQVYRGKINDENSIVREGDRMSDVIHFDDIVNRAIQIAMYREGYIDKELSPEQQQSKKILSELERIAKQARLANRYDDKKILIAKISEIDPAKEYYPEIRERIKKLKNDLELFNEQSIFLDHNKLIALCVSYMRKELAQNQVSRGEKILHAQNRANYFIKVFLRPVYQAVADASDLMGSTGLSEAIAESDFKTFLEYTDVICEDVIKRSRNPDIKFTEYPDPQIQSEIEKIMDNNLSGNSNKIKLPPLIRKLKPIDDEEISCFTPILIPLLTRFSSIIKPISIDSGDISSDDEPLVSTLTL